MKRLACLNAGLLVGWIAGAGDAVAVLVENPRSFDSAASAVAFAGVAVALSCGTGGVAGLALAASPRRPGPGVVWLGVAGWLFAWVGVRVHVKWFFGEPLTAWPYAAVNLGLALAAIAVGLLLHRAARGRLRFLDAFGFTRLVMVVAGLGAAMRLVSPSSLEPVAAEQDPPAAARDVLLITLDTTRADHLSSYGYPRGTTPALDRLARRGTVWPVAYAPIPLTNPSHASIFSGRLPREHGVRNNGTALPREVATFVPALASQGWNCAAFVSGIPLKAGLSGLAPGFSAYDDTFSPLERVHPMLTTLAIVRLANRVLPVDFVERRAEDTARAAVRWLADSEGPRFVWVHFFDPHTPYDAPSVMRARFAVESPGWTASGRAVGEWPMADYDAELREADRHLEDLVRAFDAATDGRGVVVVTADHGEGLEQHGELAHGSQLFEEDLRVPLIHRGPLVRVETPPARPVAPFAPVSTTMLARWLSAWAGARPFPNRGDAPAADAPVAPGDDPSRRLLFETFAPEGRFDQSAVLDERGRKVLVNWDSGAESAYDLLRDPGETAPREVSGEWSELRADLVPPDAAIGELDPEVVRRLRALGYLH